jgi:hypothetical protein
MQPDLKTALYALKTANGFVATATFRLPWVLETPIQWPKTVSSSMQFAATFWP